MNACNRTNATRQRPTGRAGVVIPVYNRKTILLETLDHVLRQTQLPDRLVVADDGSHDGTADAAEEWLRKHARNLDWRVLRLAHHSAAAARVAGYEALGATEYVAFLDSDDHWPVDFLGRATDALDAHPDAAAATCDRRYTDKLGQVDTHSDCLPMTGDPVPWMLRFGAGIASCTVVRSRHYEAAGGWSPEVRVAEDTWLFAQVATLGPWLHLPGDPVDFYLGNARQRGEHDNLSRRHACMNFRWARVYESLIERIDRASDRKVRGAMARVWRNAGKEMQTAGREGLARNCYARSLAWRPVQYNATRRLLASSLAGLTERPARRHGSRTASPAQIDPPFRPARPVLGAS